MASLDVYLGNNIEILENLPPSTFRLAYMDPPFNTGKIQARKSIKVSTGDTGDRVGFKGKTYSSKVVSNLAYEDRFDDFVKFLFPVVSRIYELLTNDGSIVVHLDYREVHNVKVFIMDEIFGSECFMNEIIWAYDYGARTTKKWSAKHDTLLWYVKDPTNYIYNFDQIDRVPYMAPGLQTKERARYGKPITDTWWHTIVCGKEKTGYPTQKPYTIVERFVKMNSMFGDKVIDPFAGSGTFGDAALNNGRSCVLIDKNPEAIDIILNRLCIWSPVLYK